ncbi:hypothetical protein PEDI_44500 [Persicobacter diffluens]|uniref:Uncharacterized protein n=1 Tax=Persicobacter diffluens TaxID=981 RepID=A0AAN5APJ3_9BACT|nr:hypothetical protein PEDI_44500 [Persicobacter diffluens]
MQQPQNRQFNDLKVGEKTEATVSQKHREPFRKGHLYYSTPNYERFFSKA